MKTSRSSFARLALFILLVVALVCMPFVVFGEDYVFSWLEARQQQAGWLTVLAIVLLACDSVAPVPSSLVIMFLAAKAGRVAGIVGGSIGLAAGVLVATWIGRVAVGRVAAKVFPTVERAQLQDSLRQHLGLTLACLRSVPVLAETSVILAAAAGIRPSRIFFATLLPNIAIAVIYSVAADDSFLTACLAFAATIVVSYGVWRWLSAKPRRAADPE